MKWTRRKGRRRIRECNVGRYPHSAISPWRKEKLWHSGCIVNSIAGLLKVRIDVSKPSDTTTDNVLKVLAVRVEELIISLFIADASNGVRALRFNIRNSLIGRWPAILRIRSDERVHL